MQQAKRMAASTGQAMPGDSATQSTMPCNGPVGGEGEGDWAAKGGTPTPNGPSDRHFGARAAGSP